MIRSIKIKKLRYYLTCNLESINARSVDKLGINAKSAPAILFIGSFFLLSRRPFISRCALHCRSCSSFINQRDSYHLTIYFFFVPTFSKNLGRRPVIFLWSSDKKDPAPFWLNSFQGAFFYIHYIRSVNKRA